MIRLRLLYFGPAADAAGGSSENLELTAPATIATLRSHLFQLHPKLSAQESVLRFAVNMEYAPDKTALSDGDEVAVIPPVAGGAPEPLVEILEGPIDLARLIEHVESHSAGAICTFQGTVREEPGANPLVALEYTAYGDMALAKLRGICEAAHGEFEITAVAAVHTTGELALGEASVAVAVSAPHRVDGFRACRYIIDELKKEVPVWKREIWKDGASSWVDPTKEEA